MRNGGMPVKIKKVLIPLLLGLSLLCGAVLLFLGLRDAAALGEKTKDYESTEGYLYHYERYTDAKTIGRRRRNTTYLLTYTYFVDGGEYSVSTTYGTSILPERGSTREVLYDPENPSEAVLAGTSGTGMLIFGGALFLGVPGIMIFLMLMGDYKARRINIADVVVGVVFAGLSFGVLYLMAGTVNVTDAFREAGPPAAIPAVMIAAGVYLLIRGIFFPDALEKMKGCEDDEADAADP